MSMSKKLRLDQLLVSKGLFGSREQAQRAVMAGEIKIGTRTAAKPSQLLEADAAIAVKPTREYVGRGALKLEGAFDHFRIDVHGNVALDIGASTGGFTDCLLQRGAAKVYAVDVGHGQLDWRIRNDPRVVVLEKLNARFLSREHIPELVDVCVIDVSFISLNLAERVRLDNSTWRDSGADQTTIRIATCGCSEGRSRSRSGIAPKSARQDRCICGESRSCRHRNRSVWY
jgi:TlyA family rRNA methyltransferase/putative hemolysin